jgi:hypothetical protein
MSVSVSTADEKLTLQKLVVEHKLVKNASEAQRMTRHNLVALLKENNINTTNTTTTNIGEKEREKSLVENVIEKEKDRKKKEKKEKRAAEKAAAAELEKHKSESCSSSSEECEANLNALTVYQDHVPIQSSFPKERQGMSQLCASPEGRIKFRQGLQGLFSYLEEIASTIQKHVVWLHNSSGQVLDDEDRRLYFHTTIQPLESERVEIIQVLQMAGDVLQEKLGKQNQAELVIGGGCCANTFLAHWREKNKELQQMSDLIREFLIKTHQFQK